jgi:hypothetical protein
LSAGYGANAGQGGYGCIFPFHRSTAMSIPIDHPK